jgi:hypothetical protein
MRRFALCLTLALLVSMTTSAGKADAGFEWCSEDPTFIVNGNVIDVTTIFPAEYARTIKGPVVVELLVPQNAVAAVLTVPGTVPVVGKITKSLPRWWGLFGMPVVVRVTVNSTEDFDHYTQVTGTGLFLTTNVRGQSNQVMTANYRLLLP